MTLAASGSLGIGTGVANRDIAIEFGLAPNAVFPTAFYGKGGAPGSGALSFADFLGRSAAALGASVSPTTRFRSTLNSTGTTATAVCSGSAGTTPYTFAWNKVSGDAIAVDSPASGTTTFTATSLGVGETRVAVFNCTITDNVGATATSNNITVTISNAA